MAKEWKMPSAKVEKFVANEYVAACWTVVCDIPNRENRENRGIGADAFNADVKHGIKECGKESHQFIKLDSNGNPVEMIETNTQGMGNLPCTIYTDDSYQNVRSINTVQADDYIYWTSSYQGTVWHHHGEVQGSSNHS